jgi:hypothetical protein
MNNYKESEQVSAVIKYEEIEKVIFKEHSVFLTFSSQKDDDPENIYSNVLSF